MLLWQNVCENCRKVASWRQTPIVLTGSRCKPVWRHWACSVTFSTSPSMKLTEPCNEHRYSKSKSKKMQSRTRKACIGEEEMPATSIYIRPLPKTPCEKNKRLALWRRKVLPRLHLFLRVTTPFQCSEWARYASLRLCSDVLIIYFDD